MKLNLKRKHEKPQLNLTERVSSGPAKKIGPFQTAVLDAIKVTEELNELNTLTSRKMTARALVREILELVHGSQDRIEKLRSSLENREPGLSEARTTVRRMVRELRSSLFNWASVPKDPSRLKFLSTEATNSELALRGYSYVELFCVAVQIAGKEHPECFGTCEDSIGWATRVAELSQWQKDLFAKISATITAEDLLIGPVDPQGRAKVSFKVSNGDVPIAPQDNAGERLVSYLLANAKTKN